MGASGSPAKPGVADIPKWADPERGSASYFSQIRTLGQLSRLRNRRWCTCSRQAAGHLLLNFNCFGVYAIRLANNTWIPTSIASERPNHINDETELDKKQAVFPA